MSKGHKEVAVLDINENLRITLDRFNWMVQRKVKEKDGFKWSNQSYFSSLDQAVKECIIIGLTESEAVTLEVMVEQYDLMANTLFAYVDASCVENFAIKEWQRLHE